MVFRYQDFSTAEKMGMSIIPNAALFFIFRIVMDREKWDDSDKKAYAEIFLGMLIVRLVKYDKLKTNVNLENMQKTQTTHPHQRLD